MPSLEGLTDFHYLQKVSAEPRVDCTFDDPCMRRVPKSGARERTIYLSCREKSHFFNFHVCFLGIRIFFSLFFETFFLCLFCNFTSCASCSLLPLPPPQKAQTPSPPPKKTNPHPSPTDTQCRLQTRPARHLSRRALPLHLPVRRRRVPASSSPDVAIWSQCGSSLF